MSANRAIIAGLPGRYALALFELAQDAKALDDVARDCGGLRVILDANPQFKLALHSPRVRRDELGRVVARVAATAGLNPIVGNFLGVLAKHRRTNALDQILSAFAALHADHKGEVTAEVRAAYPLDAGQVDALKTQLRAGLGRDVQLLLRTDPALLGGLVVKIGSRQVDSSVRTKLNRLSLAMKGAG